MSTTADVDRILSVVDIVLCTVDLVILTFLISGRTRPPRAPARAGLLLRLRRASRGRPTVRRSTRR